MLPGRGNVREGQSYTPDLSKVMDPVVSGKIVGPCQLGFIQPHHLGF